METLHLFPLCEQTHFSNQGLFFAINNTVYRKCPLALINAENLPLWWGANRVNAWFQIFVLLLAVSQVQGCDTHIIHEVFSQKRKINPSCFKHNLRSIGFARLMLSLSQRFSQLSKTILPIRRKIIFSERSGENGKFLTKIGWVDY